MEFCPKCGAVIMQKGANGECLRCGFIIKGKVNLSTSEKIEEKKEIAVIKDNTLDVRPITDEKCMKCSHGKCYFWTRQTRGSDEAETRFFECVKCNHTFKQYR